MKQILRFLVPVVALFGLLALAACDSGGGDDPAADTQAPPADTQTPGEDIPAGDEDVVAGEDVPVAPVCNATNCPADECKECADGQCVTKCADGETCNAGVCEVQCDPACGACELCVDGACVAKTCDETKCEECDTADGECKSTCAETEFCNAAADPIACETKPECPCEGPYCDASVVDEFVLASGPVPTADPPVEGCCCDFDNDGEIDNNINMVITLLGATGQEMDLASINTMIAEQLAEGSILILFEHLCLDDVTNDDYMKVNLYLGADTDEDPTNNLGGTGVLDIMPQSLDGDGNPLITFDDGSVVNGRLAAGPAQFIIPVAVPEYGVDLALTVDAAKIEADVSMGANGYELANGDICGYVTRDTIFTALNGWVGTNCGCLGLGGDIITNNGGVYGCTPATTADSCNPDDQLQSLCPQIANYCTAAIGFLPMLLDLDSDGDGAADAFTIGGNFGATSATINGVAAE